MKENTKKVVVLCGVVYCTIFAMLKTEKLQFYVSDAVERCILTVIPSLFAMMAISGILLKSNVIFMLSRMLRPVSHFFGMNGNIFVIFLLSMTAGYPIGARLISEEYECGRLTKRQAELYTAVCFGAGPAFIFGCVSDMLFSGSNAGVIILISIISVNFITAVIISALSEKCSEDCNTAPIRINSETIVESAVSAGKSMFNICTMIVLFSVFLCVLEGTGIPFRLSHFFAEISGFDSDLCRAMFASILEVTNLGNFEKNNYTLLPFVCAAISFGGICVILQIKTVLNSEIGMRFFVAIRILCGIASGFVCRIIMPFMLENQTVTVSDIEYKVYSSQSSVPSYMLTIMLIMLMCRFYTDKTHVKKCE